MRFTLSPDHRDYATSLTALLNTLDCDAATRAWSTGNPSPGLKIWRRLADQGVQSLTIPTHHGGLATGALPPSDRTSATSAPRPSDRASAADDRPAGHVASTAHSHSTDDRASATDSRSADDVASRAARSSATDHGSASAVASFNLSDSARDNGSPGNLTSTRDGGSADDHTPANVGDSGANAVDTVVAFEVLGRFCPPGPWTDAAVLPLLLDHGVLASVATGETLVSLSFPPYVPYALDADIADARYLVDGTRLRRFTPGDALSSLDASRRLFEPVPGADVGPALAPAGAFDLGALLTAAQLLGAGRWLLEASVTHALTRRQFGRAIGSYQAVQHLLADVATALELATPLLYGAAVTGEPADVSAAKTACGDAAHLAARTALQVHGAVGYTAEHPLGLRLTRVRALVGAWGTPAEHRRRVLAAIAP
ncbi:acyl-CoA dehydrogenase family protein [Amycolatopsis sp. NPDC005232]|uniref:acyl-CoA dehydrogenase family protein n=1 Tax=Amycolatopsis sp. NPDC005232 TaxID=3157027 RepID=UPI0033BB78D4